MVITRTPCAEYLTSYIKLGAANNTDDVRRLELFLNTFEGFALPIDGVYSQADYDAVVLVQERHPSEILVPWSYTEGTGYVYYTTRKYINEVYCENMFPLSAAQLMEIAEFKELWERLQQMGGTLDDIDPGSTVGSTDGSSTGEGSKLAGESSDEDSSLTARLYDAAKDRTRLIGMVLILLAILLAGIAIFRSRKKDPPSYNTDDFPPIV